MKCFKKYDVRGIVGPELNESVAAAIGVALAKVTSGTSAVIGCDARESSPALKQAMIDGLLSEGLDVFDIGTTGTEEVYFACQHLDTDIGIEVTASHNPIEYNGIKFVGKGSKPFNDEQFQQIKAVAAEAEGKTISASGSAKPFNHMPAYVEHLLSYIDLAKVKPMRLLVNAGNGVAGHVIDALEKEFQSRSVPLEFVKIFHEPDATFPNGIPNPLLPEDRWKTSEALLEHKADLAIAWDGDFDRCFLFDEKAQFIDGYYIVGLLARSFLLNNPGAAIVHDPRVFWNTQQIVESNNGRLIKSSTGHALIKATMREHDAIYGGEMSAHHYFKEFAYCDSGMIPWLLVVKLLSESGRTLSQEVEEMQNNFPSSGEINFRVSDAKAAVSSVQSYYESQAESIDMFDGLSMAFNNWRFNLRSSATEPLLRLNVESASDKQLLQEKTEELVKLLETL